MDGGLVRGRRRYRRTLHTLGHGVCLTRSCALERARGRGEDRSRQGRATRPAASRQAQAGAPQTPSDTHTLRPSRLTAWQWHSARTAAVHGGERELCAHAGQLRCSTEQRVPAVLWPEQTLIDIVRQASTLGGSPGLNTRSSRAAHTRRQQCRALHPQSHGPDAGNIFERCVTRWVRKAYLQRAGRDRAPKAALQERAARRGGQSGCRYGTPLLAAIYIEAELHDRPRGRPLAQIRAWSRLSRTQAAGLLGALAQRRPCRATTEPAFVQRADWRVRGGRGRSMADARPRSANGLHAQHGLQRRAPLDGGKQIAASNVRYTRCSALSVGMSTTMRWATGSKREHRSVARHNGT